MRCTAAGQPHGVLSCSCFQETNWWLQRGRGGTGGIERQKGPGGGFRLPMHVPGVGAIQRCMGTTSPSHSASLMTHVARGFPSKHTCKAPLPVPKQGGGLLDAASGLCFFFFTWLSEQSLAQRSSLVWLWHSPSPAEGSKVHLPPGFIPWWVCSPAEFSPKTCCSYKSAMDGHVCKESCCFAVRESHGSASDQENQLQADACIVRAAPQLWIWIYSGNPNIFWERWRSKGRALDGKYSSNVLKL